MTCEPELMDSFVQAKPNPFLGKIDNLKRRVLERRRLDLGEVKELCVVSECEHIEAENNDVAEISLHDSKFKDDMATMQAPIYSLSKNKDTEIWYWESVDGKQSITVIPSILGRATINDKDIIIYVISCLMKRKNLGLLLSKTVRFKLYDYLQSKDSAVVGRSDYLRFKEALKRLKGTTIETNIKTDNIKIDGFFSLVDGASMVEINGKLAYVEITLSDWIFNGIDGEDVLTINSDYFKLHKPLEKRLYEIARKHCNNKGDWKISIEPLLKKAGSRSSMDEFKRMLREIIKSDRLPDYRLKIDGKFVVFYQKDTKKLADALGQK